MIPSGLPSSSICCSSGACTRLPAVVRSWLLDHQIIRGIKRRGARGEASSQLASSSRSHTSFCVDAANNRMMKKPNSVLKHKRRLCQVEGCPRIVKSQGRCQRHGAKPKSCKVAGCPKQAQGNFDGMCKSHFHEVQRQERPLPKPEEVVTLATNHAPKSVYETVLPTSIGWSADSDTPMPLIKYLKDNFDRGTAWHRNDERMARGMAVVASPAMQLEGWERELVWTETLLLTGTAEASFRHLARAWGRDKGFHRVLAQSICNRQGNVERHNSSINPLSSEFCTPVVDFADNEAEVEVWDGACYYEMEYNERLVSELMSDLVEEEDLSDIGPTTPTVEGS